MTSLPRRLGTRSAIVLSATVLIAGVALTPVAADPPTQDDIDRVLAEAETTEGQIAGLEVLLTENSLAAEEAGMAAAVANEDYLEALSDLEIAQAAEEVALEDLEKAEESATEAAQEVAAIAMAAYRNGGSLQELEVFLSADGVESALNNAALFRQMGGRAETIYQRYEAAELVASLAAEKAASATKSRETAATELEEAAGTAQAQADAAVTALTDTQTQHTELISELARLRNTSVELEEERQASRETDRLERQNTVARSQAEDRGEVETPADGTGAAPATSAPVPTTAAPAPTTSAPAPSTPAPAPTTPAAPAPTTPAPAPTTPAPTTSAPAPSTPAPTTPAPTTPAPAPSGRGQVALNWARTQLGKPYLWGGTGPNSYDCSGLTMRAFQNAGYNLPRTSRQQYGVGTKVPLSQVQVGDLVFWSNNGTQNGIYHVAIYAGNGQRLHAPSPGRNVELVAMSYANIMPYVVRL